ncbi:MAG: Uma2 family endonuclease [Saprospiraceae bacterium]
MHEPLLAEEPIVATALSDYEIERNKPMPNRIHGSLQSQIIFLLKTLYSGQFQFPSELSLATAPSTTPDICIYHKKKLNVREVTAKEIEMPLTTIEILSPRQSLDELASKAWDIYFPAGVQSAWIVVPELKAIQLLLPNGETHLFYKDTLTDPVTNIQISVPEVFEDLV